MFRMTRRHIMEACQGNKYLLLRNASDFSLVGVNCALALLNARRKGVNDNQTRYIGYRTCDLMEYITHKIPFTQPLKK